MSYLDTTRGPIHLPYVKMGNDSGTREKEQVEGKKEQQYQQKKAHYHTQGHGFEFREFGSEGTKRLVENVMNQSPNVPHKY